MTDATWREAPVDALSLLRGAGRLGTLWHDPAGTECWDEGLFRIAGLDASGGVPPGGLSALLHPQDAAHLRGTHATQRCRILRPDGEVRYLQLLQAGDGARTVVIDDTRFTNVVERGRNVLTRTHLGANEILQMAGRVHGRVEGGQVFILSDRNLVFHQLEPTAPEFQLAGDSERVAMTCAALGVRADELELPVPLDRMAYRAALNTLESRGIVENGRLTRYGKLVEATPVERPWAELLVQADDAMVPAVAVMASAESLHRMTREDRNLEGLVVQGSDHLSAYNVYAEALA